jgi:hypothetical protein
VTRPAKAPSVRSTSTTDTGKGLVGRAFATLGATSRRRIAPVLGCVLLATLVIGATSAQAALVHPYLSQFAAGPREVCGFSADPANGDLFAAQGDRVNVFSSAGTSLGRIVKGPGSSELEGGACSSAVNDTTHQVYVAESEMDLVYVYNESGGKFTAQEAATIDGADTPAGSFLGHGGGAPGFEREGDKIAVAVAQSTQDVYVLVHDQEVVDVFNSQGEYQRQIDTQANPQALATDSNGDLYVSAADSSSKEPVIDEFGPSGAEIRQISGPLVGSFGEITGLAVDSQGRLYVSDGKRLLVDEFDSSGGFIGQMTGSGSPGDSFNAPQGVAAGAGGDVYVADSTVARERRAPGVVDVFGPATSEAPPFLEDEGVSDVTSTGATLRARIDPTGVATAYRFEYGPEGGPTTASPELSAGSGEGAEEVSLPLSGLLADTTYHFHVVVVAHTGQGTQTEAGADRTFTTQPAAPAALLPDGRAWELVSPVDKHGALIKGIGALGIEQAAADGSAIAYSASAAIVPSPESNASEAAVISSRGAAGWSTRGDTPPALEFAGPDAITGGHGLENRLYSADLSLGLVEPFREHPLLSPLATEGTPYLHDESVQPCLITETTCYTPLVAGQGEDADVPPGTKFNTHPEEIFTPLFSSVEALSATPDLSHVIVQSSVPLVEGAAQGSLYEWTAEASPAQRLQLISVLPGGQPATGPELGFKGSALNTRNAISASGSRIAWTSSNHLYLRDTERGETIQLDEPEAGVVPTAVPDAVFQTASTDGSVVFFTDEQALTANSTATKNEPDLYACRIVAGQGGELGCKLNDLTSAAFVENPGESAAVQGGVLGASADGSSVYFVANGVLSDGENTQGESAAPGGCGTNPPAGATCNLYRAHYNGSSWEQPTFIAALSPGDGPDWATAAAEGDPNSAPRFTGILSNLAARVSPDGAYVAFMSARSLTGYDNTDASSDLPDEEVYLYGAAGERLICASCNPSGARPHGVFDSGEQASEPLVDRGTNQNWEGRWLAADIPGWDNLTGQTALYQSRYLSNSGRLFFNSSDPLVPADTNGVMDVYEHEPPGVGSCTESSPTFDQTSGGCLGLISSGTSGEESAFLDASESGDDVFFITAEKLTSQDVDTSYDVYDAHVCATSSPCIAPPPPPPPPCASSAACQEAVPSTPSLQTPSSSTFSGPGNKHVKPKKPHHKHHHHKAKNKRAANHKRGGGK